MKRNFKYFIVFLIVPIVLAIGVVLFHDRQYALISLAIALLSCLLFFFRFEHKTHSSRELIAIAAMVALSSAGRFIFAMVPGFKPVTAIVVISAIYFGSESGFLVGSLSAVVSNMYFGQGPWTPFQMFSWGIIGFIAGLLAGHLKNSRMLTAAYGAVSGILFSIIMDIWTVIWWDGSFNSNRYLGAIISSIPFMAVYVVSNALFIFILYKPIGRKLERLKIKYGIGG